MYYLIYLDLAVTKGMGLSQAIKVQQEVMMDEIKHHVTEVKYILAIVNFYTISGTV